MLQIQKKLKPTLKEIVENAVINKRQLATDEEMNILARYLLEQLRRRRFVCMLACLQNDWLIV